MDKNKEYLFIFKNGGWWLKVSSIEALIDYHEQTDSRWEKAFNNLIHSKEFGAGMQHADAIAYAIGLYGSNRRMTPIDAVMGMRRKILEEQLVLLKTYGTLYINRNGGYHFKTKNDDSFKLQWVRREKLIFPDFTKNEIRVSKFPGGTHFYAYIGDMQVRDGDILKWNTYGEAMEMAARFCEEE